ncbi:MAG TPA: 30S ribosomal protein S16 [bacterium]|nr:30S ribosomal protein S16 [bacterium]
MSVKIRLARRGKKNAPFYHIVVSDERQPRDSSFVELVGTYDVSSKEKRVVADKERIAYWLSKGAKPSETVSKLIKNI